MRTQSLNKVLPPSDWSSVFGNKCSVLMSFLWSEGIMNKQRLSLQKKPSNHVSMHPMPMVAQLWNRKFVWSRLVSSGPVCPNLFSFSERNNHVCRLCVALVFWANFCALWVCLLDAVSPAATHMVLKIICIRPLETIAQHKFVYWE